MGQCTEQLKAVGFSKVMLDIEAGAEIKNIACTMGDCTQADMDFRQTLGRSGSDDVSSLVMDDPEFEQPYGLGEQRVECAASVIFWGGNDAFDKKGWV